MIKQYNLILILIVILISTVSVTTVYAQESLLPGWIKTIAGFWSSNQISDEEFVGALQYLVKEKILVIPSEQPQINPPSELDPAPNDSIIPPSITSQKLKPDIEAFWDFGGYNIIVSLSDQQGNPVAKNGDLTLIFLDEDDEELYREKKYLVTESFSEFTNKISGESTNGVRFVVSGQFSGDANWYDGEEKIKVQIKFVDSMKNSHTNERVFSHLPLNEGYGMGQKTGFIKKYEPKETLNVGPYLIKIVNMGPYLAREDGFTNEYFRVDIETQSKQVSNVVYSIDELYIQDDKNNLYSPAVSFKELKNAFLVENGHILFEKLKGTPSEITIALKITVMELDESDTAYQDAAKISLR